MQNVAFIITKSEIGGAQTWVKEIANLLSKDCNVYLITSTDGPLVDSNIFRGISIIPGIKKYFSISTFFRLAKFIKKNNISVVVASSANAGIYSRLLRIFMEYKCIYVSHGWSCLYNGGRLKSVFCLIEKYLSKITDVIWCVSKEDARKAIDVIGISKKKVVTITNAVNANIKNISLSHHGKILFLGRLTHPKRPDLLANVIANKPQYQLDIIGNGRDFELLKTKYKSYSNVNFLGEVENFKNFHEYDLFALISDSEGLPMSALEAHTAGLPLLLSDVGGCYELIDGNGLLTNNNEKEIELKIQDIFDNYSSFKINALEMSDTYVISNFIQDYKSIILDCK
ncbi:TPA: glycosyltransferase [Citrobacter amalonaticus]|uniref:Glycosyltransferase n=1 Tax=Citrobacter amalonaticus TaxID=35703 RepID=A0A9C7V5C3_CITAM|nr:glycosyltransferase [Citrobacter amalonaticus]